MTSTRNHVKIGVDRVMIYSMFHRFYLPSLARPEDTIMADGTQNVYEAAVAQYMEKFSNPETDFVCKLESVEGFLDYVDGLNGRYARKRASCYFERLRPVLDWLWKFNSSVQSFLQASPEIFVLVWGSLSVILQVRQV